MIFWHFLNKKKNKPWESFPWLFYSFESISIVSMKQSVKIEHPSNQLAIQKRQVSVCHFVCYFYFVKRFVWTGSNLQQVLQHGFLNRFLWNMPLKNWYCYTTNIDIAAVTNGRKSDGYVDHYIDNSSLFSPPKD